MTFTPDHRPLRKLLVSAGHTTTADSEHNLNCSFCCRFQRHSSFHFLFKSKYPLSAGGTRSHRPPPYAKLQKWPVEASVVAPDWPTGGPAAHHSLVLSLVVSYARMTSD